jgi:hypothetical protein
MIPTLSYIPLNSTKTIFSYINGRVRAITLDGVFGSITGFLMGIWLLSHEVSHRLKLIKITTHNEN